MYAEKMRSEMARETKHMVVGWVLRADRVRARMVSTLPTVPTMAKSMAHIAPTKEVASLKRMAVPSS